MAQDIVVKESLTDAMVRDGAALVERLDAADWSPDAALWFYSAETNSWRLLLASDAISVRGPREAYTAVQSALAGMSLTDRELMLEDVGVIPADHALVGILRSAVQTDRGIGRIRFSKNVIDGHFIDDALIYRVV